MCKHVFGKPPARSAANAAASRPAAGTRCPGWCGGPQGNDAAELQLVREKSRGIPMVARVHTFAITTYRVGGICEPCMKRIRKTRLLLPFAAAIPYPFFALIPSP